MIEGISAITLSSGWLASLWGGSEAMIAVSKAKATGKAKRRRRPREEVVYYIVVIEDWDWGYSLSLNLERQPIYPYHEFRHLHVRGKSLHPRRLKDRIEKSCVAFKREFISPDE